MLLTHEHVLFCHASCEYVNAKGEYGKTSLHLTWKKIHDEVVSTLFMVINLVKNSPNSFFLFHKSKIVQTCGNYVNIM